MKSILETLARQGDISGLSYGFARFIAEQSPSDIDSLLCCSAALVSECNQRGDVCIELEHFAGLPLFESKLSPEKKLPLGESLQQWRQALVESPCVGEPGDSTPLILEQHRLYLNRYWYYEDRVADMILQRLNTNPDFDASLTSELDLLFPDSRHQMALDEQRLAVSLAASHRFLVISGGPGTGKTSTVVKILALLLGQKNATRIKLAAPTGKAAARMMASIQLRAEDIPIRPEIKKLIPVEAGTIHRLLGYHSRGFRYNHSNPLALDCLVIDEASMIDLTLMYHLLDALPPRAQIILLGDRDQLASVSAGNVLGDITGHGHEIGYSPSQVKQLSRLQNTSEQKIRIASEPRAIADAIALLTKSYRFSEQSDIGRLAGLINQGASNKVIELLETAESEIKWHQPDAEYLKRLAIDWLLDAYNPVVNSKDVEQALTAYEQSRALCATHSGPFGVDEINRLVEAGMQSRQWIDAAENFRGKPVLITTNDYELGLFNGDTGILWPDEAGQLRACFRSPDQGIRQLSIFSLPEHVTAWTMTVHKAQGSEFDSVLLILPSQVESKALSRELLYTGITRARKHLQIHASNAALLKAIDNLTLRRSGLAQKLGW